jgi:hypothetical protein
MPEWAGCGEEMKIKWRIEPELFGLRKKILKEAGHKCHYCGGKAWQLDHITPVYLGGTHDEENLVSCCGRCNHLKGIMAYSDFKHLRLWEGDFKAIKKQRRVLLKKAGEQTPATNTMCGHGAVRRWCCKCRYSK